MHKKSNIAYQIHHVASILERQAEQILQDQFSIGFSQFKILMALKWQTNVRQRQIADSLGQTEASVSRQIKLMHEQGLLQNKISPDNRRQRITSLTLAGDKIAQAALAALNNNQKKIFADLNDHQQKELLQTLDIVHNQLCQSNNCRC